MNWSRSTLFFASLHILMRAILRWPSGRWPQDSQMLASRKPLPSPHRLAKKNRVNSRNLCHRYPRLIFSLCLSILRSSATAKDERVFVPQWQKTMTLKAIHKYICIYLYTSISVQKNFVSSCLSGKDICEICLPREIVKRYLTIVLGRNPRLIKNPRKFAQFMPQVSAIKFSSCLPCPRVLLATASSGECLRSYISLCSL